MRIRDMFALASATALVAAPAMANPAAPLSVSSSVRSSASNSDSSKLAAGGGLLAVALLGAGIIVAIALTGSDDNEPASR